MEEVLKYYYSIRDFFNSNYINIATNIISSLIFLLLGLFIGYFSNIKSYLKRRSIEKYLFSFKNIVIFSGSKKLKGDDNTIIRIGDFYAIYKIIDFIKKNFPLAAIKVSDPYNEVNISDLHNKNLIAIGGPNNNPLVKNVFDYLEKNQMLKYKFEDYCIKSVNNEYFCLEKNKNKIVKDYGLIYVLKNPFSRKKIIIFAGCKSFGTLSAIKIFSTKEFIDYKNKEIKRSNFIVLIECNIHNDRIVSYEILKDKTFVLDIL